MSRPKVTVYIPSHNYGRFIKQAIESVLRQSLTDWELILVDDGSEDDTASIAKSYADAEPEKIGFILHETAQGLQKSANEVLHLARGKYIIRLDADDYLDDNALLVLVNYLDLNPNVALVYPNYIYVDEYGNYLGVENRKQIGTEANLLDLPAHGACTLVRTRVLKSLGGYDEKYDRQDGYELWLKVVNSYPVGNISTPLFFYRQHGESLTQDEAKLLDARARIKRDQVEQKMNGPVSPRSLGVVLAKNTYQHLPNIVLTNVAGKPLINYTLDEALSAGFDSVIVTTDDPAVCEYCQTHYPGVRSILRPKELTADKIRESTLVNHAVNTMEENGFFPDAVVVLGVHTPLRNAKHIQKALDTLFLYNVDSVISVYEDRDLHYVHAKNGLEKLNPAMHRRVRVEREGLFVENGAVRVLWRDILTNTEMLGKQVGHFVMPRRVSYQIKQPADVWLIEQVIRQFQKTDQLLPDDWTGKGVEK